MPTTLYGREGERAALDRLLDDARAGTSGVLVLRGEPGIGKSALLDHAAATAEGHSMRVLRATGVEYEAELPFAALHLLLAPGLHRLPALPGPQRDALEGAFGLAPVTPGRPADRLLTGLAVLSLLSELADERPLLCVVDDAQWLDRASADALLLAARRLKAEPVALILAARDGEGAFDAPGLPELPLTGLDDRACGQLLDAHAAGLAPAVRGRVLAEAHGNPLALTELPAALAGEGTGPHPGALPLTTRLQVAFHGQVSRLPPATQTLLLVAAAERGGRLDVVERAAATLGAAIADLQPAQDSGLVRLVEREFAAPAIAFRHPLLRAAVHQRAPLAHRLAVHRALADALATAGGDPEETADRRAWHLAIAADGPDETIAAALEKAAVRAHERGGHAAAADAIERAARLTPDPRAAVRRHVLACEAAIEAGHPDRADAAAERTAARITAHPDAYGPDGVGWLRRLNAVRATARFWQGDFPAAHRLLAEEARRTADDDPRLAARMLLQAFHAAWYLGGEPLYEVVGALTGLALPDDDPLAPLTRYLVRAVRPVLASDDPGDDVPDGALRTVDKAVEDARRNGAWVPWDVVQVCGVSLVAGQDADTHRLATALAAECRAGGAFGQLPTVLFFLAEAELFHGRHRDARATAGEALRIAEETGQHQWTSQLTGFLAYRAALDGDEESCRAHGDRALTGSGSDAAGAAPPPGAAWVQWAYGVLDLGLGRAEEAVERLAAFTGGPLRHTVSATRAVPDLVEAAVRLGRPDRATDAFAWFHRWSRRTGQPWTEALVLRCRALLGDDPGTHYPAALALHSTAERPFEQARTALLYGEWLRRGKRKAEARTQLRAALEAFERLGAVPWADRARTELGATGEAAPRAGGPGVLSRLTPQELQIVRLAAQGMSNRDIAAQLFLSPRTVGYHLYKAYPKLGVTSRGELAALDG